MAPPGQGGAAPPPVRSVNPALSAEQQKARAEMTAKLAEQREADRKRLEEEDRVRREKYNYPFSFLFFLFEEAPFEFVVFGEPQKFVWRLSARGTIKLPLFPKTLLDGAATVCSINGGVMMGSRVSRAAACVAAAGTEQIASQKYIVSIGAPPRWRGEGQQRMAPPSSPRRSSHGCG